MPAGLYSLEGATGLRRLLFSRRILKRVLLRKLGKAVLSDSRELQIRYFGF